MKHEARVFEILRKTLSIAQWIAFEDGVIVISEGNATYIMNKLNLKNRSNIRWHLKPGFGVFSNRMVSHSFRSLKELRHDILSRFLRHAK